MKHKVWGDHRPALGAMEMLRSDPDGQGCMWMQSSSKSWQGWRPDSCADMEMFGEILSDWVVVHGSAVLRATPEMDVSAVVSRAVVHAAERVAGTTAPERRGRVVAPPRELSAIRRAVAQLGPMDMEARRRLRRRQQTLSRRPGSLHFDCHDVEVVVARLVVSAVVLVVVLRTGRRGQGPEKQWPSRQRALEKKTHHPH